jgi:hypothetical protein
LLPRNAEIRFKKKFRASSSGLEVLLLENASIGLDSSSSGLEVLLLENAEVGSSGLQVYCCRMKHLGLDSNSSLLLLEIICY